MGRAMDTSNKQIKTIFEKNFGTVDFSSFPNRIIVHNREVDRRAIWGERYIEYRRKWNENPKDYVLEDFPLHIDIELTTNCNLKCPMCMRNVYKQDNNQYIKEKLFLRILDECVANNIPSIKFIGRGEVLLHDKFPWMVKTAKERGIMEVHVTTNATLLSPYIAEQLLDAGIDNIVFSFDGATKETYESIRIGAVYEEVVGNVVNLLNLREQKGMQKPVVQVQMVCMKKNSDEIKDFVQFWKGHGVNRVDLLRYRNVSDKESGKKRIAPKPLSKHPCGQLWQRLAVFCDGTVSMCCGDYKPVNNLGNVSETPLKEVWKSSKLSEIRKKHRSGRWNEVSPCNSCEVNSTAADNDDWNWLVKDLQKNTD